MNANIKFEGYVIAECYDRNGKLKWRDEGKNLIVDEGINYIWANDMEAATLYVGLKDTGTPVAGDTAAQIGGTNPWAELSALYDEATREAFVEDASGTDEGISNSGSPASFTINATGTPDDVYGAFLVTTNTKQGTAGSLIGVKDFAAAQTVSNGDTLNVTYTVTGSSS